MYRWRSWWPAVTLGTLGLAGCGGAHPSASVDDARLRAADADSANWLTHGRTYAEQRFSPLAQITDANVDRLGLAWSLELGTTRGVEATPLVLDGVIYATGTWSVAYAIDARTGELLWRYDPEVPKAHGRYACCDVVNRGLAMYEGRVFLGTIDGRLVAIDAGTGTGVWEVRTTPSGQAYTITGAPRVADGMVLIGNGGAEYGVRGFVSAYAADDGELLWRTYTVPGNPADGFESEAMERAAETWSGEWWRAGGGGTAWDAIVYDPELDLVYVGTGNASPWYRDLRGPGGGDNLYVSSIIALRADDGELVWHYQTTPGDHWDYTATQPLMLAELDIDGATRRVIMQAPKNGFFYVLDRETGALLSAEPFVGISWASHVDMATGRPVESPAAYRGMEPVVVSPGPQGAHNWYPMAFNPSIRLVYIPTRNGDYYVHNPDPDWEYDARWWNYGRAPVDVAASGAPRPYGRLVAWDPVEQREAWGVSFESVMTGGVLTTAGDLVFHGRSDGTFAAYRASDGEPLWEFDAGTGILAPAVTYLVDGVQHVTLMVGWGGGGGIFNPPTWGPMKPGFGRVLTFRLDGSAAFEPPQYGPTGPPRPALPVTATPATLEQGGLLFQRFCAACHGVGAVAGIVPDLRYMSAETHGQMQAIVLEGARESLGMPGFGGLIAPPELEAIRAYVLARAAAAAAGSG